MRQRGFIQPAIFSLSSYLRLLILLEKMVDIQLIPGLEEIFLLLFADNGALVSSTPVGL